MTRYVSVMVAFTEPGAWTETIIPIENEYPAVFASADGREFVLARRPGVVENVLSLGADGSLPQSSTMALYIESEGVDATCVQCEVRVRFRTTEEADDALAPCRAEGHAPMLLYAHLADENVIDWLNRTVGDVREQCPLLP